MILSVYQSRALLNETYFTLCLELQNETKTIYSQYSVCSLFSMALNVFDIFAVDFLFSGQADYF